jgi:hypothetical protein
MGFKTNVLTGRGLITRMIEDAQIEKLRLETKLGSNTVSEYRSTRSAEETAEDKAQWEADLAKAEATIANAAEGSREKRGAELDRDQLRWKLNQLAFDEEGDSSDPKNIVDAAVSLERTRALLDVQVALIAELNQRLTELPA